MFIQIVLDHRLNGNTSILQAISYIKSKHLKIFFETNGIYRHCDTETTFSTEYQMIQETNSNTRLALTKTTTPNDSKVDRSRNGT